LLPGVPQFGKEYIVLKGLAAKYTTNTILAHCNCNSTSALDVCIVITQVYLVAPYFVHSAIERDSRRQLNLVEEGSLLGWFSQVFRNLPVLLHSSTFLYFEWEP
jgi:hypothetical protein